MHVQRALRLEDVIVYERLSYEAYFFLQPTNSSECLMFQEKQKKNSIFVSFSYLWRALNGRVRRDEFVLSCPIYFEVSARCVPRPRPIFNALRFLFALPTTSLVTSSRAARRRAIDSRLPPRCCTCVTSTCGGACSHYERTHNGPCNSG